MAIGILTGSGTYALPGLESTGPLPVYTPWGEVLMSRGTWDGRRGAAHLAPRPGPPAALQPGHAPREHRGAEVRGRDRRARRDRLRRGRSVRRARVAGLLRRPALPLEPPARRLAVHVLHRAGCARARPLDLRVRRSRRTCAPRCSRARRRRAWRCSTAGATATSTARASTPPPRSARSRRAGVTAVSQTAGPETVLCGEAELPYALLGFLTDYANGVKDEATPVEHARREHGRLRRRRSPRSCAPRCRRRGSTPDPPGVVYRFAASD